ncbi:MAG: hypothetical protein RBU37_13150 [Myxococcota bacterium]|jgi:hypothetical protein|nr:hypothetical protein [Myxococcota bacterium]
MTSANGHHSAGSSNIHRSERILSTVAKQSWCGLALLVALLAVTPACAGFDAEGGFVDESEYVSAQLAFSDGRVHEALHLYSSTSDGGPNRPSAMVGEVLCRLLLLPEHEGSTRILMALGAEPHKLPLDAESMLYSRQGLFQLFAQGATTDLVEERMMDALPWERAALEAGPEQLFASIPLTATHEELRPGVLLLDAEMAELETQLQAALEQGVQHFSIPAGSLALGVEFHFRASDLQVLRAVLLGFRSLTQFTLAYDYPIPLRMLLTGLDEEGRALDPSALADLLNQGLWRALAPTAPQHLENARLLASEAVDALLIALESGPQEEVRGELGSIVWSEISSSERESMRTMLDDLQRALEGERVTLSGSLPEVSLDMGLLFDGPLLAQDAQLFVVTEDPCWCPEEPCFCEPESYLELDSLVFEDWLFTPLFTPDVDFEMQNVPSDGGLSALDALAEEVRQTYRF